MISSPARRRLLGAVLRHYREQLGYDLRDSAAILECDQSKISRIETGQRAISPRDLRALLEEYQAGDDDRRLLAEIADPGSLGGWQEEYSRVLSGPAMDYLSLEATAKLVLAWAPCAVPGLLQTSEYARALAACEGIPRHLRDRCGEAVAARQQALREQAPMRVSVVLGEAALRHLVGGPDIMRDQLHHLASLAAEADDAFPLTIRVLPFKRAGNPGLCAGPVTVLGFPLASGLGVAWLPGPAGGLIRDDPDEVAAYARMITKVEAAALTPRHSARMIADFAVR